MSLSTITEASVLRNGSGNCRVVLHVADKQKVEEQVVAWRAAFTWTVYSKEQ